MTLFTSFSLVGACLFSFSARAAVYQIVDSDFESPDQHLVSFDLHELTQPEPNVIQDGPIRLILKDNSLGDLNLNHLLSGVGLNRNEKYSVQILYTAEKVFKFYERIGRPLPPLDINLQDPALGYGVGGQAGGATSLYDIKEINDFHGGRHPFEDFIPFMTDILAHEISHHAQRSYVSDPANDPSVPSYKGRLGSTAMEGHANLMAWLIMGSSTLGRPESMNDSRSIAIDPANYLGVFGRVSDAYNTYAPFASVWVALHDRLVRAAGTVSKRQAIHERLSEIYFEIYTEGHPQDTFQTLALKTLSRIQQAGLATTADLKFAREEFLKHGLDLDKNADEGYTRALLINGLTADRINDVLRNDLGSGVPTTTIEAQSGLLDELVGSELKGVTVGASMAPCLQSAYSDWLSHLGHQPSDEELNAERQILLFQCAVPAVNPGGVQILTPTFMLSKSQPSFLFSIGSSPDQSMCIDGFVFANLLMYSSQGQQLCDLQLPFRCRP